MMNGAKAIAKKYNEVSLILRIVVGLVIGAVLALTVPGAGWVAELGTLFVGALKAIAPLLVQFGSFRKSQYVELVTCEQMADRYKKEGI